MVLNAAAYTVVAVAAAAVTACLLLGRNHPSKKKAEGKLR